MYGKFNEGQNITQLGWIQLDTACQNTADAGGSNNGGSTSGRQTGSDIAVEIFEANAHDQDISFLI